MRYWTISFPGEFGQHVQETWSEEQLLRSPYYNRWIYKMCEANMHDKITNENFIDDWTVVYWAVETGQFGQPLEQHEQKN